MDLSLRTESFLQDNSSWLGSAHGTEATRSVTLDSSKFVAGTHYPNGFFPSGLVLGLVTATGLYGPYDDTASDGRQTAVGFLAWAVHAPWNSGDPVVAALQDHGRVIAAKLPIAIDAAGKTDLAGHFIFV